MEGRRATEEAQLAHFIDTAFRNRIMDALEYRASQPSRLRGAGGDGGSTGAESRSSYLEMYKEKKEEKVDPSQQRHARWTRCAYSGKPLKEPIVADPLGNLFNKADLLEGLAAKASGEPWPLSLSHIRLKDLLPVQVQPNPSYEQAQAAAAQEETGVRPGAEAPFQCPLTGRALNGCGRTLLHRPTALVFTDSGLKKAPGVARELLLEAANKLLAADGVGAGEKKGKKKAAAAARLRLEAVVARGGRWDDDEMLVLNPEGDDAEVAKGRQHAMQTKAKVKGAVGEAAAAAVSGKRDAQAAMVGPLRAGAGKRGKTVLQALFHSDAEAAATQETYCCRSTSARGFVS